MTQNNTAPDDQVTALKQALNTPIALVGMMGTGKSHVGQALARALGWEFFDSDHVIEEKAGMPVSEIFATFGEEKFREVEKNTIAQLLAKGRCVLATGGGAVMNDETRAALKAQALCVWLQADVAAILKRLEGNKSRPLLQTENPEETLRALMKNREHLYAQADVAFDTTAYPSAQSTSALIKTLCAYLIPGRF